MAVCPVVVIRSSKLLVDVSKASQAVVDTVAQVALATRAVDAAKAELAEAREAFAQADESLK